MNGPQTLNDAALGTIILIGLAGLTLIVWVSHLANRQTEIAQAQIEPGTTTGGMACMESLLWTVIGLLIMLTIGGGTVTAMMAAILNQP